MGAVMSMVLSYRMLMDHETLGFTYIKPNYQNDIHQKLHENNFRETVEFDKNI